MDRWRSDTELFLVSLTSETGSHDGCFDEVSRSIRGPRTTLGTGLVFLRNPFG